MKQVLVMRRQWKQLLPCHLRPLIGELLSKQHATQKLNNRHALHEILICVKYLCRQGLPLRGDKDESDGNFIQLLKMKAEVDSKLTEWLKRKENNYTRPTIQNEMIKLMGTSILCDIASTLHSTPFLTVMVDETTDSSNTEQVIFFLCWVTDSLQVHEDAASVTFVITDLFLRCSF